MERYQKHSGFIRSVGQAWRGIVYTWKTQGHLQFHVITGIAVLALAWWSKLSRWEWLILIYAIGCVIIAEIFNTAIELAVDLAQPNFHPLAGMAKDVAAGAVLVTAIQAIIIGAIIFLPVLSQRLGGFF